MPDLAASCLNAWSSAIRSKDENEPEEDLENPDELELELDFTAENPLVDDDAEDFDEADFAPDMFDDNDARDVELEATFADAAPLDTDFAEAKLEADEADEAFAAEIDWLDDPAAAPNLTDEVLALWLPVDDEDWPPTVEAPLRNEAVADCWRLFPKKEPLLDAPTLILTFPVAAYWWMAGLKWSITPVNLCGDLTDTVLVKDNPSLEEACCFWVTVFKTGEIVSITWRTGAWAGTATKVLALFALELADPVWMLTSPVAS